ncbi:MAG: target of Sbf [Geoglossum umbratile]|nr:MAG: target of Sbf [Geoglossum umbratile]
MRQYRYLAAGAAIAASISGVAGSTSQELCAGSTQELGGNYYCKAVKAVTYKGVGYTGSYDKVTMMDPASGQCSSAPYSFSGQLAPLCDDIAMHIRGPVHLKQFAVYYQNPAAPQKRESIHKRRGHHHLHKHREAEEKRADYITATINGQVVSWPNPNGGAAGAAATPPPTVQPQGNTQSPGDSTGDWLRAGYYDAASQTLANLTFLNNMGGQKSGTWDMSFGNSLAYASSNCGGGASSPQTLADALVPSGVEYSIWSGAPCSGGDCGYYRPGTIPMHGFKGGSKVFMMEFSMPNDAGSGMNSDMPAIWFLNGQIGRTLQYGKPECSCWKTGCGEFDVFEVLDSGNFRCKSTIHSGSHSGGDSNYFTRPTGGFIKAAILFDGPTNSISIQLLDSSTAIPGSLTQAQVTSMWNQFAPDSPDVSIFQM